MPLPLKSARRHRASRSATDGGFMPVALRLLRLKSRTGFFGFFAEDAFFVVCVGCVNLISYSALFFAIQSQNSSNST